MAVPVSDLQAIAPSAVIELYELELNVLQHGVSDTYRFHSGTSLNASGQLTWNGNAYLRFPIEAEGFEYSGNGQLPRPKVRVSNILGTITAVILSLPKGIEGAKFTRIRTLARYIDAANFPGSVNPYGTPDPTAEFPREIFYVDRKVSETRDVIEFELAAVFDLAGVRAPKRQCIANICQWKYKSTECGWSPSASVSGTYVSKAISGKASTSGTTITLTSTAHGFVVGDYAYFDFPAKTGTTSWLGTTLTINCTAHGFTNGSTVYLDVAWPSALVPGIEDFQGNPPNGYYVIGSVTTNSFVVTTATDSEQEAGYSGVIELPVRITGDVKSLSFNGFWPANVVAIIAHEMTTLGASMRGHF